MPEWLFRGGLCSSAGGRLVRVLRQFRLHSRQVLLRQLCFWVMASCAVVDTAWAASLDGQGRLTISPTTATVGTAGNKFTFTFSKTQNWPAGSVVTIVIPNGWSAPQTGSPSLPGFLSPDKNVDSLDIIGTGPWTVIVTFHGSLG